MEIENLKKEIYNTKKFTHKINDNFMNKIYNLKLNNLNNNKNYKLLSHLENYITYQNEKLNNFKNSLLTLISTIFLPLGFIVGFFGMNFASMGNPGIKKGILAIESSEKFIFIISILTIIIFTAIFKFIFDVSIL